ncbi:hypothetical protein [Desulfosporosinus acidiphilus]|uniref:hypothetical protein n=1 Tax=Desulfosporosinus acidiphilus TaxID=885581 RepID=UPI00130540A6|nr:hypothetical protein [Desulfosporosinus acidiphilus]
MLKVMAMLPNTTSRIATRQLFLKKILQPFNWNLREGTACAGTLRQEGALPRVPFLRETVLPKPRF